MRNKPPAVVGVRISKGERHDFDAAVPLPTRALSLEQGRAGGLVKSSPKLAELTGSVPTCAEEISPFITISASAAPFMRLRVLVSDGASASMAKRGYRASCSRPAKRCFVALISSASSSKFLSDLSKSSSIIRHTTASVG